MTVNYSAKSPDTGTVYHCTSKAEHVRLLARGYADVTGKSQQQKTRSAGGNKSEAKTVEADTEK